MYVTVLSIIEGRILKHMQTILLESEKLKTACRQAAEKGELRRRSRRSHAVSSRDGKWAGQPSSCGVAW